MRFTRMIMLAGLALSMSVSAAHADQQQTARSFGTYHCKQQFSCAGMDSSQASAYASQCAASGLGTAADFSSASLDSSNCLTAQIGTSGKNSSSARCCAVNLGGDSCAMDCTFLLN